MKKHWFKVVFSLALSAIFVAGLATVTQSAEAQSVFCPPFGCPLASTLIEVGDCVLGISSYCTEYWDECENRLCFICH